MRHGKFLALILAGLIGSSAHAQRSGGSSDGGGGAFVRQKGKKVESELLDLWEGRNRLQKWDAGSIKKLNIPYTNEDIDFQIRRAVKKIADFDPGLYKRVQQELTYVQTHNVPVPKDQFLAPPADAKNGYNKVGWDLKGMMLYDSEIDALSIKHEIFDHLINNTNIAAAWVHEALYKALRDIAGQTDSRATRKMNACLFATDDCFGTVNYKFKLPTGRKVYACNGKFMDFYYYETEMPPLSNSEYAYIFVITRVGAITYPMPLIQSVFYRGGAIWSSERDPKNEVMAKYGFVVAHMSPFFGVNNGDVDHIFFGGNEIDYSIKVLATGETLPRIENPICTPFN